MKTEHKKITPYQAAERQRANRARLTADITIPLETSRTRKSTDPNRNTTQGKQRVRVRTEVRRQLDPDRRSKDVETFDRYLRQTIVGQDAAVDAVVDIFQMFSAGLSPRNRPVGNILFLGPTGTGKTKVVEALAEVLFGSERALIKIDCAEFQYSHEIAKLIGSPPGYLGHRETHPVLNQEAIDQYHTDKFKLSLILFDEIEKASDALWQLLLGIFDKGSLTLGDNHRVDLSSCMIFLTSNLGATEMSSLANGGLGFRVAPTTQATVVVDEDFDKKITRTAQEAARRKFSPEFMNRIDKTVVFKTLRSEHLRRILDLELVAVQQRVLLSFGPQFLFNCEDEVKELLLSEGTDPKYGARHLKRVIERYLVFPLANLVATHQIKTGDGIKVTLDKDAELVFTVETEGSATPTLLANGAATI
jgi:ATP-dependent Clp protease ATP-binding subunit ClpA